MKHSVVSVLIPARNAISTIEGCLSSALSGKIEGESPEIVVVDDWSDDGTAEFVTSFAKRASCVRLVRASGRGISSALNTGIAETTTPYIARLDADDEMHPLRLEKQLAFIKDRPRCGALGTSALIGQSWNTARRVHDHPTENMSLRLALLFSNPFVHPSMLIRRECLKDVGGYKENLYVMQDYELWSRMSRKWELANLSDRYTLYRETPGSLSRTKAYSHEVATETLSIAAANIQFALGVSELCRHYERLPASFYGAAKRKDVVWPEHACVLLYDLATRIAGPRANWSKEFQRVFAGMRQKLWLSCLIGRMSPALLAILRICRQRAEWYASYLTPYASPTVRV
jgi:glycosyltransferase involved in cell wall biosynthesis